MPKGVDEKIWTKAVDAFTKQYDKKPSTDRDYAVVSSIYQKMGGGFDFKELREDLTMDSPFTTTKLPEEEEEEKNKMKTKIEQLYEKVCKENDYTDARQKLGGDKKKLARYTILRRQGYSHNGAINEIIKESLSPLDRLYESVCREKIVVCPDCDEDDEVDGKTCKTCDGAGSYAESLKPGDKVHSPSGYAKVISVKGTKVIVRSNDPAGDFEYDMKDVRKESVCKEDKEQDAAESEIAAYVHAGKSKDFIYNYVTKEFPNVNKDWVKKTIDKFSKMKVEDD